MGRRASRRRRHLIALVVATGVVPAFVYIGATGLDGDNPSAPAATPAATGAPAEPSPTAAAPTTTPESPATPTPSAPTAPSSPAPDVQRSEALAALESLPVKGRAPKTGYDRDQFGPAWADVDGNGCDTRNDILARDLTQTALDPDACTVRTGLLAEPYGASWVRFVRGENTSALVQIDHVVALSDAWQKGAQQLTPVARERLANDPLNLLAVDGGLNQQKSDGDAATWLPPNKSIRCDYVARQVAVKARYDLWITAAERDAIARILSRCPGQPLPTGNEPLDVTPSGPAPSPGTPPPPAGSASGDAPTAFANCTAAREAGAAPLRRGEPGYGDHLDGDGDGVACE